MGRGGAESYSAGRIADTVAGFLPDGITPEDIGLDIAQLADDVSELDAVNAEDYVHAVTNRELAKHIARKTLGDIPESEITRITDAYELITRGRLEGARMAHFRTNPTALARLVEFLKEAITSLYGRLTARYDNGTAMLVNRLARELAHARDGFNHDIRTSRGYDPEVRMLPSVLPSDEQFNQEVNEYVTNNWSDDPAARITEIRSFAKTWLERYRGFLGAEEIETTGDAIPGTLPPVEAVGTGVIAGRDGSIGLNFELKTFITEIASDGTEFDTKKSVARIIQEEVFHAAHLAVIRKNLGRENFNPQSASQQSLFQLEEILGGETKAGSPEARALYGSFIAYNRGTKLKGKETVDSASVQDVLKALGKLNDGGKALHTLVPELARQVVQLRRSGGITEERSVGILGRITQWFREVIGAIRSVSAEPSIMGSRFADDIADIENILNDSGIRFLPSTLPSVAAEPPVNPALETSRERILNSPHPLMGYMDHNKGDAITQASFDRAPRSTAVREKLQKLFVDTHAGVSTSIANADKLREAQIRTTEYTAFNVANQVHNFAKRDNVDFDIIAPALGSTDPEVTPEAEAAIIEAYRMEMADAESSITREYKSMFPEYRETLDRMIAEAKDDAARDRAYAAADQAFSRAYAANPQLAADAEKYLQSEMDAAAVRAEESRVRATVFAAKAEVARRKDEQRKAFNRLSVISPDTYEAVLKLRAILNDLQGRVHAISVDKPFFQAKIEQTRGVFLVRSYGIHQDPKVRDAVIEAKEPHYKATKDALVGMYLPIAKKQIMQQLENDPEFLKDVTMAGDYDATIGAMENYAEQNAGKRALLMAEDFLMGHAGSQSALFSSSTVSNELARYMKKANLPEEIQRALQVNTDPVFNAVNTVVSLGRLLTNSEFLNTARNSGVESGRYITAAEKASGVTFARGRDVMRQVFAGGGNDAVKAEVRDSLFVKLKAITDSRFLAGRIAELPTPEQIAERIDASLAAFAAGTTLDAGIPELNGNADRIATDAFLSSKRRGVGIEEKLVPEPGKFETFEELVSKNEGNSAYNPLGGLYASKEDAEAFRAAFKTGRKGDQDYAEKIMEKANKFLIGSAGLSLAFMTVGNPAFFVRNSLGGLTMALANGVDLTNPKVWREATRFMQGVLSPSGQLSPEFQELIAGRIAFDGANTGYVIQLLKESGIDPSQALEDFATTSVKADYAMQKAAKKGKNALRILGAKLGQLAEASEVVATVMVYIDFKDKLTAANFGTELQIQQEASRLTKRVMPSKSEASSMVKRFTGSGAGALLAPFIRFKADMIRNTITTPMVALEWARSDNAVLQKYGRRKLAAFGAVYGAVLLLPVILRRMMGFSDEEDDLIRAAQPVYLRNASLYYWRNEAGNGINLLNMSYTTPMSFTMDPLSRMTDTVMSAFSNRDATELAEFAPIMGRFLAEDFVGENIMAGAVLDTMRNKDSSGFTIYSDHEDWWVKGTKSAWHIVEGSYVPAIAKQGYKLQQALGKDMEGVDDFYTPWGIAKNTVKPFKIVPQEYDQIERRAASTLRRQKAETSQILWPLFGDNPVTPEQGEKLYLQWKDANDKINRKLHDLGRASIRLRGDTAEAQRAVEKSFIDAKLSKRRVQLTLRQGVSELPVIDPSRMGDIREKHPETAARLAEVISSFPRLYPVE